MINTNREPLNLPSNFRFEETVLFLGSGFSSLATAINQRTLPLGSQLDSRLAEALNLTPGKYDGKTLAEIANRRADFDVEAFLSSNLTVKDVSDHQAAVVCHPWYRIFTTNFDNCIEHIVSKPGYRPDVFTFNDDLPNKIKPGSIIHLHGYIGKVNRANASTQIIYALKSYANLHSDRPEWLSEFNRNLAQSRNVLFVGYSLGYDDHIRDIIAKSTSVSDKTFFFVGGDFDEVQDEILGQYGRVSWDGVVGVKPFIEDAIGRKSGATDPNQLLSFELFDPSRDKQAFSPVTSGEIQNLLAFGKFNRNRFYRDSADGKYLIYRDDAIADAEKILVSRSSILAHSYLGNGKSMFLETLASRLQQKGWNFFFLKSESISLIEEARLIDRIPMSVIVIDDYTVAREVIPVLRRELNNTIFVITIRTGTLDYRIYEIDSVFGKNLVQLDLNKVTKLEFNQFESWSRRAGVVAQERHDSGRRFFEVREIILNKFRDSEVLRARFDKLIKSMQDDRRAFQAFIVTMIFRSIGEIAQAEFIAFRVLNFDPQPELARYQELWGEVRGRNGPKAGVESGLFAEFILSHFCDPDELIRVVEQIVSAIAPIRSKKTRYDAVFAKCLNFGALYRLCGEVRQVVPVIIAGYERLRHNSFVEQEPLFWLQIAIAEASRDNYRQAWNHIQAAYVRVDADFEPYHIDTKAVDVLFKLGLKPAEVFGAEELDGLEQALEGCSSMVTKDRNRGDVLRALSLADAFFDARASNMPEASKVRYTFYLASIDAHLLDLPADMKARQGTEALRKTILGAIRSLAKR
jgi:hypothetical protein